MKKQLEKQRLIIQSQKIEIEDQDVLLDAKEVDNKSLYQTIKYAPAPNHQAKDRHRQAAQDLDQVQQVSDQPDRDTSGGEHQD